MDRTKRDRVLLAGCLAVAGLMVAVCQFASFLAFKVLGIWLIVDALGSWLYDLEREVNDEMNGQKPVAHLVRFIRMIVGAILISH